MRTIFAFISVCLMSIVAFVAMADPGPRENASHGNADGAEKAAEAKPYLRSPGTGVDAPDQVEAGFIDQHRIELLLDAIVIWISSNFELPAIFEHPRIRLASDATLTAMRYGNGGLVGEQQVVALYDDDGGTIYLAESWTSRSAADLSVLVHEMVHHLQAVSGQIYSCAGQREELAYLAQEQWLQQIGHSLQQEFGVDALTIRVIAYCMH